MNNKPALPNSIPPCSIKNDPYIVSFVCTECPAVSAAKQLLKYLGYPSSYISNDRIYNSNDKLFQNTLKLLNQKTVQELGLDSEFYRNCQLFSHIYNDIIENLKYNEFI